jgi:hypothetical protein
MAKLSEKMGCGPYQSKIRWRSLCFIVLKLVEPNNGNNPPPPFFFLLASSTSRSWAGLTSKRVE